MKGLLVITFGKKDNQFRAYEAFAGVVSCTGTEAQSTYLLYAKSQS